MAVDMGLSPARDSSNQNCFTEGEELEDLSSHSCPLLTKGYSALPHRPHTHGQRTALGTVGRLERCSLWLPAQGGLRGTGGTPTAPVTLTGLALSRRAELPP